MNRKIGLFDAMRTMRAMRRLKTDPVPDELIREIIEAGTCAPSGGDAQHWRFIVVKDPAIKQQLQSRDPAVQNMLLAARALGLGATLTTRHLLYAREVDQILGLPPEAKTFAIIPIGYPLGNFGPLSRAPVEQVTFLDRWGAKYL